MPILITPHEFAISRALNAGIDPDLLAALDRLTDAQRDLIFSAYCRACGNIDPECDCTRDD